MEISGLGRYAFSICVTVGMLAGCSALRQAQDDTQPPLGAPGSTPQTSAVASARTLVHRTLPALSFEVLHDFVDDPDGEAPEAGLIDVNGTLYGTTLYGGAHRIGTVYSISTDGKEKVLHSFGSSNAFPYAGLIHVNGALYGTTRGVGTLDKGTVYSISTDGSVKVLHSFGGGSDGAMPIAGLTDVYDTLYGDTLYGTTRDGGTSDKGTVYGISLDGTERVLHSFTGGADGAKPFADLTDVYGTPYAPLYGTTDEGGTYDEGTVYSIDSEGTETVLHSFGGASDGVYPEAGLVDVNGTLYGTTVKGGTYGKGTVYSISTDGEERVLHSFGGGYDGSEPYAGLIDVNGTLYGTTFAGGPYHRGTVYSISMDGTEKVLFSFYGSDGTNPDARLLHHNGTLYGTASKGGAYDRGTVYALRL